MMFTEALAAAIVKGRKTQTRRQISANPRSPWRAPTGMAPFRDWTYPVGKVFTVNPGRGVKRVAECEVTGRRIQLLGQVSPHEATTEGFASLDAFYGAWMKINGSPPGNVRESVAAMRATQVHVVEFKLVGERCGWCLGLGVEASGTCPECFGSGKAVSEAARDLIARVEGG